MILESREFDKDANRTRERLFNDQVLLSSNLGGLSIWVRHTERSMEPYIRFRADLVDPYEPFPLSDPGQCLDEVPYHCRGLVGAGLGDAN